MPVTENAIVDNARVSQDGRAELVNVRSARTPVSQRTARSATARETASAVVVDVARILRACVTRGRSVRFVPLVPRNASSTSRA